MLYVLIYFVVGIAYAAMKFNKTGLSIAKDLHVEVKNEILRDNGSDATRNKMIGIMLATLILSGFKAAFWPLDILSEIKHK
ncbi:MAG: hypothetical protein ABF969_11920 [Sporolactobacillus sp.]